MNKEIEFQFEKLATEMLVASSSVLLSSSSSTSSSSEDEPPRKLSRRGKITNYVETVVQSYNDDLFKQHFRMRRNVMYTLIDKLMTTQFVPTHSSGMPKITAEKSFLMVVWYLSNCESFREVADRFGVSDSSAHRVLLRMLDFIISLKTEYIKWPSTLQKKENSIAFRKKQNISGVIGIIDGSHIRINRPQTHEDAYINRKGYHSLLLQGVVDHLKRFIDVFCGEPGSLHDARLLRKSSLYSKAEDPDFFENFFLLGDSAYPVLPWLIPPFRDNGALTEQQKVFNFKLSSTRMVVEHAFGLLKGRFRRLRHLDNSDIEICVKCIMAACILHNICLIKSYYMDEEFDENDSSEEISQPSYGQFMGEKNERRQQVLNEMFRI